jgi:8-oxo-dGTP diphosphatase
MSRPLIGVALFLFHPTHQKFLIGERLSSHGSGTYALPGGHLEYGESFEECAARECEEETGLAVEPGMGFLTATNDIIEVPEKASKHYVTIFMLGKVAKADVEMGKEAQVMEPDKSKGWEWISWEDMCDIAREQDVAERGEVGEKELGNGKRLFQPLRNLLVQRPGTLPAMPKQV